MKQFFIVATTLLLVTGFLQAQQPKNNTNEKHHRGAYSHQGGMQHLNLSDVQKKQISEIRQSYHNQIKDLQDNKRFSGDDLKSKTDALRKEEHEKMQSLLTPEQRSQITSQKMHKGKDGGKKFEQMKTSLGLTDEQATKLKANRENFHNKIKAIRSDNNLSESQKKDQVKALAKQQKENMKNVLTTEQIEKMKAGKKGKFGSK